MGIGRAAGLERRPEAVRRVAKAPEVRIIGGDPDMGKPRACR